MIKNEKFWSKVKKTDPLKCWTWTAYKDPRGYGMFRFHGRVQVASRVSWILTNGEIPKNMNICHHCDNPSCVNPAHLFLGTDSDNARDRVRKKRDFNTKKTHCKRGHLLQGENLYICPRGKRNCMECRRRDKYRYYLKVAPSRTLRDKEKSLCSCIDHTEQSRLR